MTFIKYSRMMAYLQKVASRIGERVRLIVAILLAVLFGTGSSRLAAQEVAVWEYSPYAVQIWFSFDSSLSVSDFAKQRFLHALTSELERTFRAAWRPQLSPMPEDVTRILLRNFDEFELDDLTVNELILVTSLEHEDARNLRTFEPAIAALAEIHVTAETRQDLADAVETAQLPPDSAPVQLLEKCVVNEKGLDAIKPQLASGEIAAALLPRIEISDVAEHVRTIATQLPWQSDGILRQVDKLLFLRVGRDGQAFSVQVRELDCPMQFLGASFQDNCDVWSQVPRTACNVITRAFAPVARVEESESRLSAELRQRAGGLIVDQQNPAWIAVGDVLQPIVRRDDRNGVPTLLEPLPWTFAAITATDGVKMQANVYTYSGGPGLQGRRNRRTQRMLLRVRPKYDATDLKVVVRGNPNQTQSGCFIYQQDLLTQEFTRLGRTDWRGRFTVRVPEQFGSFLPEAIRRERFLAKRLALQEEQNKSPTQSESATEGDGTEEDDSGESESEETETGNGKPVASEPSNPETFDELRESSSGGTSPQAVDQRTAGTQPAAADGPTTDPAAIPLNFPLMQLYVKNGDTVVAKLPMVPGIERVSVAELPDDRRRLQAEAFVRGFQGEILDLIGMRNLLLAKIQLHAEAGEFERAEETLDRLRSLRNYEEMARELERLQRDMLDESSGEIPRGAMSRIDRMFQTTRDLLQKYMQDNVTRRAATIIEQGRAAQSAAPADGGDPASPAPQTEEETSG